jgi:S1-C subfamily serine protease
VRKEYQNVVRLCSRQEKRGVGFIIRVKRRTVYILTAAHVVYNKKNIWVRFYTGEEEDIHHTKGTLKWVHPDYKPESKIKTMDIAVIETKKPPEGIKVLEVLWGDSTKVKRRDEVNTYGNRRESGWVYTDGKIASILRDGEEFTVSMINVAEGNSGGPLWNKDGKVIGMIVQKSKESPTECYAVTTKSIKTKELSKFLSPADNGLWKRIVGGLVVAGYGVYHLLQNSNQSDGGVILDYACIGAGILSMILKSTPQEDEK